MTCLNCEFSAHQTPSSRHSTPHLQKPSPYAAIVPAPTHSVNLWLCPLLQFPLVGTFPLSPLGSRLRKLTPPYLGAIFSCQNAHLKILPGRLHCEAVLNFLLRFLRWTTPAAVPHSAYPIPACSREAPDHLPCTAASLCTHRLSSPDISQTAVLRHPTQWG